MTHAIRPEPAERLLSPDDLRSLLPGWVRSLRAAGLAPTTVEAYRRSLSSLRDDLAALGRTTLLPTLSREDLEGWMGDLLAQIGRAHV